MRLFFLITILFSFSGLFSRDLIIGGIPNAPMRFVDEKGNITGIDVDIVDYIFKKLNISYKVILESSSPRLEAEWKSPKPSYDMVFTYSETDERKEYLYYAKEWHADISYSFFIRSEDKNKIKFDKYEDLKGLVVGATEGIAYTPEFWDAATNKKLFQTDIIVKNELQITKLLEKRIDIVPLNKINTMYQAKQEGYLDKIYALPKPLKSKYYYNTFVKASDYPNLTNIIAKYDEILRQMKKDGTLKKIYAKYGIDFNF